MEGLSRLCLCGEISKHRPFSEPEVNAQCKRCLSGGRPGRAPPGTRRQRGTGGRGHAGGSRRGQGPKGDSTHGAARAEAGGLPQPSSAPPSRRPEAVAASRRRLGGRRLRPRPPSEPHAETARPPVKGRRRVGRSRPQEARAERPPSPRYLWPRSRRSTCCPPPSAVWTG